MATRHDSSYDAHAPGDIKDLLADLKKQGVDIPKPVWTVGRRDDRSPPPKAPKKSLPTGP